MLTHARPHIARRAEAEFSFSGTPGQTRLRAAAAAALAVGARAGVSTSSSVGGDQSHAWPGTAQFWESCFCRPPLWTVQMYTGVEVEDISLQPKRHSRCAVSRPASDKKWSVTAQKKLFEKSLQMEMKKGCVSFILKCRINTFPKSRITLYQDKYNHIFI